MNFASLITRHAERVPDRPALVLPRTWAGDQVLSREVVSYHQLAGRVGRYVRGLARAGWGPGDRAVVILPISVDLYATVLALMASGMTAVLIDTGMGLRKILQALETAKPVAIISSSSVLRARWILPRLWRSRLYSVDGAAPGLRSLSELAVAGDRWQTLARDSDDEALITFTSGSTGRPKGSDRTHGLLTEQHLALDAHFPTRDDDIDMPCFPVVALHNMCCGITAALPPVDLRAPARVNPATVVAYARELGVTGLSGAPAYMQRLADYLNGSGQRLESVRRVFVGGAPVSGRLVRGLRSAFESADPQVVYGSTEAEPIAGVSMSEIERASGTGLLVGRPVDQVDLALVDLPDGPVSLGAEGLAPYRVESGEVGEVVVAGDHVNQRYIDNPAADAANKLLDGGRVWHRTGDLAHLDDEGRLWLVGRLGQAVRTNSGVHHAYPIEIAVNGVPGVVRSAVVGGDTRSVVAVVAAPGVNQGQVQAAVDGALRENGWAGLEVQLVTTLPVDRRHNSKIDRPRLRRILGVD